MTLIGQDTKIIYEPDGLTTQFAIPFIFYDSSDIKVSLLNDRVETPLSGYVVNGADSPQGGNVTFSSAPLQGKLIIYRKTVHVQETAYPEGGRLPTAVLENDLDRIVAQIQEMNEELSRTLRTPQDDSVDPVTFMDELFNCADEALVAANLAQLDAQKAQTAASEATALSADAANSASDASQSAIEAKDAALQVGAEISSIIEQVTNEGNQQVVRVNAAAENLINFVPKPQTNDVGKALTANPALGLSYEKVIAFTPGWLELLSFAAGDLPFGWYFCNGDRFENSSNQAQVLNALSANYKTNWLITNNGTSTNVPNLFHADGRGCFLRPVDGIIRKVGSVEEDAIRNIKSTVTGDSRMDVGAVISQAGYVVGPGYVIGYGGTNYHHSQIGFDASRVVPTAAENRPLNIGMTPAIYLGV